MEKVQKDLNDIERKLNKCNKIAEKGEKIGYADAIKLGRKSNSIVSTIKKCIKDYDGTNPTEEESKKTLTHMHVIVDLTEKQLGLLVQDKAHFEKLHVGGLVKKNMSKSDEASKELEKVMLAKTPEDLKSQAEGLAKRRGEGFEKARAAFVQSVGGEDQAEGEDDSD